MVQTMSQGLYSMSTVVQGERLGQFLENEFPSMDNLKVKIMSPCLICTVGASVAVIYFRRDGRCTALAQNH